MLRFLTVLVGLVVFCTTANAQELGKEGFADSQGVKIHYQDSGSGPTVVFLHGFPDYSYTWRDQFAEVAKSYRAVAIDLRGYWKSDKPTGVENYSMDKLVGDVVAVAKHLQSEKITVVGHDWGGAIAWAVTTQHPELVERLVILNLPHPRGLLRELKNNPEQQKNSAYARAFQQPGAEKLVSPAALAGWVKEADAKAKYVKVFEQSSIEGMLNFYKANYPREPYEVPELPNVKCPVLMIHGLDDTALLPGALNDTWKWVDNDFSLVTVPKAGHWVHRDRSELVTREISSWLARHPISNTR